MNKPLVTVIVPVYKVEQYLRNCIDSVLSQTYNNWELILVDDGSPDNCPQICDEYAAKDQRIKVIHKENGGASSARNAGLDIAKGEYITFLDSDDFWSSGYLSVMIELCMVHNVDIVQCSYLRGQLTSFPQLKINQRVKIFDNHSIFLEGYAKIIMWAKLYKSYLFDNIRLPVGKYFEDDFTTWKWYYEAKKIAVTNHPLYYYTYNNTSIMYSHRKKPRLDFIEAYEERIDFFKRNGENDLEDFSRGHLCKAMLLLSANPMLSLEQRGFVNATFRSNWKLIKCSGSVAIYLRVLLLLFRYFPKPTLGLLKIVR